MLLKNLAPNDLFFVTPLPLAAWKETTQLSLAFPAAHPYQSFIGKLAPKPGSVLAVTIDDLVQALGLPRLDWIKIDIEGTEVEALQGAVHVLKIYQPTLWIEIHHTYEAIRAFLTEVGYHIQEETSFGEGLCYIWAVPLGRKT